MKTFMLTNNTLRSRGWAYAPSIYPRSELAGIDCDVCGANGTYPNKEFDIDLELGVKFPDILMCGAWAFLIVSQKVINDWKNNDVTGFEYYRVGINKIKSKKLRDKTPPQYYHVVITGRCELDMEEMGVTIKERCPKCSKLFFNKDPWEIDRLVIKESSWSGDDLFISELFPGVNLCTDKVIITACKNKHTNFRFIRLEDAFKQYPDLPEPVNYLKYCK